MKLPGLKHLHYLVNVHKYQIVEGRLFKPADQSLLLLEDGYCMREHALSACHLGRSEKINLFSASSLHTLVQMVNKNYMNGLKNRLVFFFQTRGDSILAQPIRLKLSNIR